MDKAVILVDAVRMVSQLRDDAQKLRESNESLQEKINELKVSLDFDVYLFYVLCASIHGEVMHVKKFILCIGIA